MTRNPKAAEVPPGVELAAIQQLIINNGVEVQSLDPHKTEGVPEKNVMRNLMEGLVNVNRHGQVVPGVAARWESADLKTWIFYLRPEAKWSNGDRVTAHDFVSAWRRLADPKIASPYAATYSTTDIRLMNSAAVIAGNAPLEALGITALDDHTLQICLSQPVSYLPKMLALSTFYPLHQPTVQQYGNGLDDDNWFAPTHHVGNGAYRLKEWVVNEKLVLTRSPTYWDNQHTVIDQVTYLTIEEEVNDIRRYRAGEIDITNTLIPHEHWYQLQKELPGELYITPSLGVHGYQFNTSKPPFHDVRVRTALSLALDREVIVKKFLIPGQTVAYTLNSNLMEDFKVQLPEWSAWSQEKRNQRARKLLQEAGYTAKHPLQFSLLYNISEVHQQFALALSGVWKQNLGCVEITLENQEWKVYLNSRLLGNYQAARFGWPAFYDEPAALLNSLLSYSSTNCSFYTSQRFDDWMAQALNSPDPRARCQYYQQAEMQLAADVPLIPIYYPLRMRLVKPYVGGLSDRNRLGTIYVKDLYLIKHAQAPSRYRQ